MATDSSSGSAVSGELTTNGASDTTLDFGFIRPAVSVGDFVWVDTDRDGVQDAGEPGIAGVTVTLTGPTGLPVTDVNGNPVTPATTNAAGSYGFSLLPVLAAGQHYTATVTTPAGYIATLPNVGSPATDSSTNSATSGDLTTNGASDLTLDFGFVKPAVSVGDFVWSDTDRDGVQDTGEPGIAGVTVTLTGPTGLPVTDVNGNAVNPTTTDTVGAYTFPLLPALAAGQHYTVTVTTPAGYVPTLTGQGTPATDSSSTTATSGDLTTNGSSDLTLDFGFVKPAVSVGDFVWVDTNRNGVQDAGEPGIPGVTLRLIGPGGGAVTDVNGNAVGAVVTDVTGHYLFPLLPALAAGQNYTAVLDGTSVALTGYIPTVTGQGTTATDSSSGTATSGDLTTNGASDLTLDFGFVTPAVGVGDFVWVDTNGNGVQNAGEPGIPGVVLNLTGPGGAAVTDVFGNPVTAQTTTAAGAYRFGNLPALPAGSHYTVSIDQAASAVALAGYTATVPGAGADRSVDSSTLTAVSGNLITDGSSDLTLDFGFVKPVSVGDFVWRDINSNGIQGRRRARHCRCGPEGHRRDRQPGHRSGREPGRRDHDQRDGRVLVHRPAPGHVHRHGRHRGAVDHHRAERTGILAPGSGRG